MEWNPEPYMSKHSFVYEGGRDALTLLAPQSGERILDWAAERAISRMPLLKAAPE